MKDIKCVQCGLFNWAIEEKCLRCGLPLAESARAAAREAEAEALPADDAAAAETVVATAVAAEPEEAAPGEGPVEVPEEAGESFLHACSFCGTRFSGNFCTLCRKPVENLTARHENRPRTFRAALFSSTKAKIGVSLLLGFIVVASVFAYRDLRGVSAAASETYITELIQKAAVFKHPLSVQFETDGRGELGPGVEVLQEIGLVSYTTGLVPSKQSPFGMGSAGWTNPTPLLSHKEESKPAPPRVKFSKVELTEQGLQESQGWEPVRGGVFAPGTTTPAVTGWRVPVGEREFVAIKKISLPYPNVYTISNVEFTWRWKPNQTGRYFDINSQEFKSLSTRAQQSARRCQYFDSARLYNGKAVMTYEEKSWGVSSIEFVQQPQ